MGRISRKQCNTELNSVSGHGMRIFKTAVYTRLSDEDIRKKISDSIGTQKTMLLQFLDSKPDLQLYRVYEDVNYTGTNFNRPGFTRMIEDIQAGLVDCVVVKDLSRFGRSFEEMGNYLERVFPFYEVRFISINDNYDSLTASLDDSALIVPLKNLMNEVYARDISRKVQSSVRQKQKRGEFCGSFAPYGYIKDGKFFIIDEETAPVVRKIFAWIIEGHSDIVVTQKLNDLKILPPNRYRYEKGVLKAPKYGSLRLWCKKTVKSISENPVYTGVMAQGKSKSCFLCGGGVIHVNREEWMIIPNAHPAIISAETFETVRMIRETRKLEHKTSTDCITQYNKFKGHIFCGDCKRAMTRNRLRRVGGDAYFFLCNVYEQVDKNACTKKRIMESDVQAALYARVSREIMLAADMSHVMKEICEHDAIQIQREESHGNKSLLPENKYCGEFYRFEKEECLSAEMISAMVERIEVYADDRICVTLCYRDEFEKLHEYLSVCGQGQSAEHE